MKHFFIFSFVGVPLFFISIAGENATNHTIINFSIVGATQEIYVPIRLSEEPFRKNNVLTKMSLRSNGCTCQQLICGCCLDLNVQQFNYERTGCMNITFDPREFSMTLNMFWNDESLFQNTLSGKNPPALCIPFLVPYIPITLDTCFKVFDITMNLEDRKMHACLDLEARIQSAPLLILHFDCLEVGSDASFALVKPMSFYSPDYDDFEKTDFGNITGKYNSCII